MQWRALCAAVGVLVIVAGFGRVETQSAANAVPVLAELFTSQGCNSCPPADGLLEVLLQAQPIPGVYVVTLSEHVTYWDHQGWKDPFGSQQFTTRQQQYGDRFNLDSVFTPQMVIDGTHQVIGSDKRAIEKAFIEAAKTPKPALHVEMAINDGALNMSASGPGLTAEKDTELWFAIAEDHLVIDVKRGENANKTLKHSGVVRILRSAGGAEVTSGKLSVKLAPEWKRENLRVVAFVQSKKNRRVVSVGFAAL
jgi:hypothetical protein